MAVDTDLALEAYADASKAEKIDGAFSKTRFDEKAQLKITEIDILTISAAERLGKPVGKYITAESDEPLYEYSPCFSARCKALAHEIAKVCGKGSTLIVGLGNRKITADSLGPLTADRIFATRHIKRLAKEIDCSDLGEAAVIAPGVMAQTGLESSEVAAAVCKAANPRQVIVCDALACSKPSHMGRTVQICSTGISPGSGVENAREELSRRTLGVATAAIGIPTVSRILGEKGLSDLLVTPKPADKLVEQGSALISAAVNLYLHPTLSAEEISSLIM
jgi:spore protease